MGITGAKSLVAIKEAELPFEIFTTFLYRIRRVALA